jgi:hypothetical protein
MKNFKFFVASAVLALMRVPSVFAQTKANFAGTWAFNHPKPQTEFRMAADKWCHPEPTPLLWSAPPSLALRMRNSHWMARNARIPVSGESIRKSTVYVSRRWKGDDLNSVTPFEW